MAGVSVAGIANLTKNGNQRLHRASSNHIESRGLLKNCLLPFPQDQIFKCIPLGEGGEGRGDFPLCFASPAKPFILALLPPAVACGEKVRMRSRAALSPRAYRSSGAAVGASPSPRSGEGGPEGRMGCGKQGSIDASQARPLCKLTSFAAAGHTPSGLRPPPDQVQDQVRGRLFPASWGRDRAPPFEMCECRSRLRGKG